MLVCTCLLAAAGCGGGTDPARTETPPPAPAPALPPVKPHVRHLVKYLTVVDGDLNTRIPGARVRIGDVTHVTRHAGGTLFRVLPGTSMNVTLQARGYSERQLPISFGHKTKSFTLRMYRPASQWPMYGVTPRRTQSQTSIRLRPPFKVVWSKGLGSLLEFPAVVSDGVAYIVNYRGTVWALSMRFGSSSGA